MKVTFYSKKNCPLCEQGLVILQRLSREMAFDIEEIDIYSDDHLLEEYGLKIPVVEVDGRELGYGQLSEEKLRQPLRDLINVRTDA